ncbi:MAG: type I-U CRISPR-associated helicase/endonuclease Cas3 [Caldilineaceae bacterium]|nr:type I-U CRISPR-associated helicase/endonuclease Cas3 [Caldilineaceae bacterium]
MTKADSIDFVQFFEALWGNTPFAWQQELADGVSGNADGMSEWPEAIDLPTAAGKTACVDIAVFALAKQASRMDRGEIITAPRRVFFVVDRRVIVDQAYERARKIAQKLCEAENGVLKSVADSLRQIAFGSTSGYEGEMPLRAYALRGGMFRSEAWARDPLQPVVVASTVDQVGSRLLFRAYGRGSGAWPVYAALIANDSLIFLDEAHCAQPFMQTLQAVRRYRQWAHTPLERAFHPVVMSATPPRELSNVFEDKSDERLNPDHQLGRRQLAHKPAVLKRVGRAKGKRATVELAKSLAGSALDLVDDRLRAIVVFVNRVATARETYEQLNKTERIDVVKLTGRMRPIDKDRVVDQHLRDLQSDYSEKRELKRPVIVVATQTLEVGADLDFDGLVTECASLDALRQRFGRLNRMGRSIDSRAVILIREDQAQPKKGDEGDPVYGAALTKTWDWLNAHKDKSGEVDFGIAYLDQKLSAEESGEGLNAPSLNAPVMLPAHVDCWAQTAPEPRPSPDVALFLHGPGEGIADVQVCWRADIDLTTPEGKESALEVLRLCPPSSRETLPVPIGVFRRWLSGEEADDDSSDVEGTERDIEQSGKGPPSEERCIVRWRGSRDTQVEDDITAVPRQIRPADVIVIPTDHPGRPDQLGDFPANSIEPVDILDIGDRAHMEVRAKPILRLHRKLVDAWPEDVASIKEEIYELLDEIDQKQEQNPEEIPDVLGGILVDLAELGPKDSWLAEAAGALAGELRGARLRRAFRIVGGDQIVIVGNRRIDRYFGEADTFSDEDDVSASGISHKNGRPVRLESHLRGVETFVRRYAVGCGLPDELIDAVARAGLLHDVGKIDPRFQALLRGGVRLWDGEPLAKSGQMSKSKTIAGISAEAGYPRGGRHELLSVRLAESAQTLLPPDRELRDLVLHMIASHHGHCRPFAPVVRDAMCVNSRYGWNGEWMHWSGPTNLERLDSGVAERYWRLVRRYGWWGLAWLEALLRLADWRRSELEETNDEDS